MTKDMTVYIRKIVYSENKPPFFKTIFCRKNKHLFCSNIAIKNITIKRNKSPNEM